ncbi:hypothetical protein D3C72_608580 [compost metagenome]
MAADTFQIKRGTTAAVNAYLPAVGEPVYDITLKTLKIGDGVTMGGVESSPTNANLVAIAGLTGAADTGFYFTGVGAMATFALTPVARALLDDTTVAAQRASLGSTAVGDAVFIAANSAAARTAIGVVIGTDVQAFDSDLAALAANVTNGLWARTGTGTGSARTITGTANEITVTNGDGVAGNPTISLPASISLAGKTVTNGGSVTTVDINGGTVDGAVIGGASPAAGTFTTTSQTTATVSTSINLTGGQIAFPAVQVPSANANTLDDYEEGTFTPTITFGTPGDLNVVYSVQTGTYTKIGRLVHFWVNLTTTTFTHTTASGALLISGLPFAASGNPTACLVRWVGVTSAVATPQMGSIINGSNVQFEVMNVAAGTTSAITTANAPTGVQKNIFVSGTYNV